MTSGLNVLVTISALLCCESAPVVPPDGRWEGWTIRSMIDDCRSFFASPYQQHASIVLLFLAIRRSPLFEAVRLVRGNHRVNGSQ